MAYGNAQKRDPAGVAYYTPFRQPGNFSSVYSLALADYTQPPEVQAIVATSYDGQAGWTLRVQAYDPYGVVSVQVQVIDAAGQVLEEGATVPVGADWWSYTTRQAYAAGQPQRVRALVHDRPGNAASRELALEVSQDNLQMK